MSEVARDLDCSVRNVLVFRIGSLGDTLAAVPALRVLREYFSQARITLLCDHQPGTNYVIASDVLKGTGTVDEFLAYTVGGSRFRRWTQFGLLLGKLRRRQFDVLAYLAPSRRGPNHVRRDRQFFRLAGIRRFVGMDGFRAYPQKRPGEALPEMPREADLLLERLAWSGLPKPPPGFGITAVGPGDPTELDRALHGLASDGGRPWIAVAPGSKMPAKVWPLERYGQVVRRLIEECDVWPVVIGGPEDRERGETLLHVCGRGYNLAGAVGIGGSVAAVGRCCLYLGNDSGPMHLAAAASVPCIAIFSSREPPGVWYPYGTGHTIFRTPIDCEGCFLNECVDRRMECVLAISPTEVYLACAATLRTRSARQSTNAIKSDVSEMAVKEPAFAEGAPHATS